MINVAFIVNGSRKESTLVNETIAVAKTSEKLDVSVHRTQYVGHATELAQELTPSNDILVAVGGDGTCNEVVNGIQKSKSEAVFGIVPNGTGNDFHRMLGKFDVAQFILGLEEVKSKQIDLCEIKSKSNSRFALNIAGAGFDGHVVKLLNTQRSKGMGGKLSYSFAIVRAFLVYKKPTVEIICEEFTYSGKTLLIAACNGTTFCHGLVINPTAKLDDGLLCVTFLANVSLMDYVRNLSKLKKGKVIDHPRIHYFETEQLSIQVKSNALHSEVDGELAYEGDISLKIIPNALNLLNPNYGF